MASKYHFSIDKGTDFELTLNVDNETTVNLASATCTAKLKKHFDSNTSVSFVTEIDASSNTITLSLTHAVSANIVPGRYVYDVLLTESNTVIRVVEGLITVNPSVT